MKKRNMVITSIVAMALVIPSPISKVVYAAAGQVSGWFTSSDTVTNKFQAGDIKITIGENFTPPSNWHGEKVTKEAYVKNENSNDELVRVAIIPKWVDENGNSFMGNTNYANIEYSNDPAWINGQDGYYYLNKVLATGETTPNIIKSVTANIPDNEKDLYKGKTLIVDVKAEAVQPTKTAYKAVWTSLNANIDNLLNGLAK